MSASGSILTLPFCVENIPPGVHARAGDLDLLLPELEGVPYCAKRLRRPDRAFLEGGSGRIVASSQKKCRGDGHRDTARDQPSGIRNMDHRSHWRFDVDDQGWYWTVERPDEPKSVSETHWPTLKECVADAAAHGYVVWKPEDERRRDQVLTVAETLKDQG